MTNNHGVDDNYTAVVTALVADRPYSYTVCVSAQIIPLQPLIQHSVSKSNICIVVHVSYLSV